MAKALEAVKGFFKRLPLKAPWEVTGVASSLEYRSHLVQPGTWRKHAPGSPPVIPRIPQAETDKIYDIKYYTRDTRREKMVVGGTNKKHDVTYKIDPHAPQEFSAADLVPGKTWRPSTGYRLRKDLLDYDNNGYT
eukprot:jgi/Astpho2/2527/Aster-x0540